MSLPFFSKTRTPLSLAAAFAAGIAVGRWSLVSAPSPVSSWPAFAAQNVVERPNGFFVDAPEALPTAAVLSVVDGDTLQILWEGRPRKLRYYGVNTPERDEPCYDEATQRNRALAGGAVRLAFDARPEDKYGRLLAYVFTTDGQSVDAALTAEGMGRAWRRDGGFRERLISLEEKARAERRGCLWSGTTAERPPRRKRSRRFQ